MTEYQLDGCNIGGGEQRNRHALAGAAVVVAAVSLRALVAPPA